jgi:cob(I)alamin adenosyltransferase
MKGYIHIYTGNGKGKTTAAIGLAIRALGAGKKVFIGQFVKGMEYSEVHTLKKLAPEVEIKQFGLSCFIDRKPSQEDVDHAKAGLKEIREIIESNSVDLLILDEANIALYFKLFTVSELIEIINSKPETMELVITGRYAPKELIEIADLVSEVKEIKHYYTQGVEARKGIEC